MLFTLIPYNLTNSTRESSSEEDDEGPNVAVSRHMDMPEGASLSDHEEDSTLDPLDPHSALAAISLEDLEPKR